MNDVFADCTEKFSIYRNLFSKDSIVDEIGKPASFFSSCIIVDMLSIACRP